MDYSIIVRAVPIVVMVTPYIAQLVKMAFKPLIEGHAKYDNLIRLIVVVISASVGAASLYFMGLHPKDIRDWLIVVVTLVGYGTGGAVGAASLYAMVNGWLHQSPPASPNLTPNGQQPTQERKAY